METVKDNNHKYKYTTLCKCCNGTGEYVRRGYDYGHGWSCEEVRRPCNTCGGTGRLLVTVEKHAVVSALTPEEWAREELPDNGQFENVGTWRAASEKPIKQ